MRNLRLEIVPVSSPLRTAFAISRGTRTQADTVRVRVCDSHHAGRGEGVPYARHGETVTSVIAALESLRSAVAAGMDRSALQAALPAGAARCALD